MRRRIAFCNDSGIRQRIGHVRRDQSKAIEPFFTTKEPGRGSGLGLSQVYKFARQSGGQLEIDSDIGRGTTIRIFLPGLVQEERETAGNVGLVLITEDDPDVLTIAAETLRLLGYDVYTATNATEALAILNGGTPIDILFTDIVAERHEWDSSRP